MKEKLSALLSSSSLSLSLTLLLSLSLSLSLSAQVIPPGGANQRTPSCSEYFSWINNTNEGATHDQTMANLGFFDYLHRTYGMHLDIYAFDAGAIDGARCYGSTKSARFQRQFPQGFGPLSQRASLMGTRLGIWGGPDGFGDTEEEAQERIDMMCSLVEDYKFWLFKMDAVCGQLRPEKYDYFSQMMRRVRQASPDFVLLNHRLELGEATKYSTTYLLGGDETYVDVFLPNRVTAPHHRASTIGRKSPEGLTRLTEDHGVCISSCLDYWDDDLILQAFARNLILAPEIYGNPWLLRDDELPYLAYIFNLHRQYRDILVDGMPLPANQYGPEAVSRGNGKTRFLALRNLSWQPVKYTVRLDEQVGLTDNGRVQVRQYHPYCLDLGKHAYGSTIEVEVEPFRAALVKVTTAPETDPVLVSGTPYYIINDQMGNIAELQLLGMPGTKATATVTSPQHGLTLDGKKVGKSMSLRFPGTPLRERFHRHIASLQPTAVPDDAHALYYATVYAADNNSLEVRSLARSGETAIPEVKAARDAFFGQDMLRARELWDKNLFDDDLTTGFAVDMRHGEIIPEGSSALYLDLGSVQHLDSLVIDIPSEVALSPMKSFEGNEIAVSSDLLHWDHHIYIAGLHEVIDMSKMGEFRYVKFAETPRRVMEVKGYRDGEKVDRTDWKAKNLFRNWTWGGLDFRNAWTSQFTLDEAPEGSYLCIAVNGKCGWENAWAALKVDGEYVGCPDRAPSYPSNVWEHRLSYVDGNYTFYVPVTKDMLGKSIEAYVMLADGDQSVVPSTIHPEVYITAYPTPFKKKTLKITK